MTTPTTRLATTDSTTVRSRNSDIGTTGSVARSSTNTAATSAARPSPASVSDTVEPQANCEPASEIQISSAETPPEISAAPR